MVRTRTRVTSSTSKWNGRSARTMEASSPLRLLPRSRAPRCCTPEFCRAPHVAFVAAERNVALATLLSRLLRRGEIAATATSRIPSIAIDSRTCEPGALFVAVRGGHTDGHRYAGEPLPTARAQSSFESSTHVAVADVTVVQRRDTRRALSALAAAFYGDPSHALDVDRHYRYQRKDDDDAHDRGHSERRAELPCGVAEPSARSFANAIVAAGEYDAAAARAAPAARGMRDAGAEAVAMEVSSHALALDRVDDVRFRAAASDERHARPSRFSRDARGVCRGEAPALRARAGSRVFNVDDPLWPTLGAELLTAKDAR